MIVLPFCSSSETTKKTKTRILFGSSHEQIQVQIETDCEMEELHHKDYRSDSETEFCWRINLTTEDEDERRRRKRIEQPP